jgi:hypothetical protein
VGKPDRALGHRTGEIGMEERHIPGQQLVHSDGVQAFDPQCLDPIETMDADTPQQLRDRQQSAEHRHLDREH